MSEDLEPQFHLMVIRPEDDERRWLPCPELDWPTVTETQEPKLLELVKGLIGGNIDIGSARPFQYAVGEFSLVDGTSQPNPFATAMMGRPIHGTFVMWGVGGGGASACARETWEENGNA